MSGRRRVAGRSRSKVCHLSSVHKVNDVRVFHKECATLADAGFDVTFVGVEAEVPERGVKTIKLPSEGDRLQRMVGRAWAAYRYALSVDADIYHFHDVELLPYGLMLKRRTRAAVIFDSHECFREDVMGKDWIPAPLRSVVGQAVGGLEDFVVRRLDQVVAATPHIAESFQGCARRVVTINNYPLEDEFVASAGAASGSRDAVCYVGAISFVRGIIPLLDALSFVDRCVRIDIAGPFAGKPVEEAARSHRNWHRVTYHGHVNRAQVAQIYARAFAGIVNFLPAPNHVFSQPNKLFEYMSAGVPVICSDFPLWQRVIKDGGCGIVIDPASPKAIADAIETLRSAPALGAKMADRGVELVRGKFNWSCEGRKLVETYDALLN